VHVVVVTTHPVTIEISLSKIRGVTSFLSSGIPRNNGQCYNRFLSCGAVGIQY
jgi:hypothetical protein